jgi:hypothetical protein
MPSSNLVRQCRKDRLAAGLADPRFDCVMAALTSIARSQLVCAVCGLFGLLVGWLFWVVVHALSSSERRCPYLFRSASSWRG